jgi:hypothetical protein
LARPADRAQAGRGAGDGRAEHGAFVC